MHLVMCIMLKTHMCMLYSETSYIVILYFFTVLNKKKCALEYIILISPISYYIKIARLRFDLNIESRDLLCVKRIQL